MRGLYLFFSFLISLMITVFSQDIDMSGITLTWDEKDKILSCTEIVSKKFQKDEVSIRINFP